MTAVSFYSFFIFGFPLTQSRHVAHDINNFVEKQKCILCFYAIHIFLGS